MSSFLIWSGALATLYATLAIPYGFYLKPNKDGQNQRVTKQEHYGSGDNIAGDKINNSTNVIVDSSWNHHLSQQQKEILLSVLKPSANADLEVSVIHPLHDPNNTPYAKEWVSVLKEAQWKASRATGGGFEGTYLETRPQYEDRARVIKKAFENIGKTIEITLIDDMSENTIRLFLGYRKSSE